MYDQGILCVEIPHKIFWLCIERGHSGYSAISKCKSSSNEELVSVSETEEVWAVSGSPNNKTFLFSGKTEPCDQKQRTWRVTTSATMTAEIPRTSFGTTQTCCTLSNPSPRYMITVMLHERYGVLNHPPLDYLFNTLYRLTPQKNQSSASPALCDGNPSCEFPSQRVNDIHLMASKCPYLEDDQATGNYREGSAWPVGFQWRLQYQWRCLHTWSCKSV